MKQQLISTSLAIADILHRHPKRIAAFVGAVLLGGGGGAYAVASLAPTAPAEPVRLVSEALDASKRLQSQVEQLGSYSFTLYRSEKTRKADTPEGLLARLSIADPEAASFLRRNTVTRQALLNHSGRTVTAEADDHQALQLLRTQWLDSDSGQNFKRLVVRRTPKGLTAQVETAPLVAHQRLASGIVHNRFDRAAAQANVPSSVLQQLKEIFSTEVDIQHELRKGDRFSVVYETLEADGEPLKIGKVLSAELVVGQQTHSAVWFQENDGAQGAYFSLDGQSLHKPYLMAPMSAFTRISSGFGSRQHPVYGFSQFHPGIDIPAPTGTPVRTIGDGVVTFAGTQRGYGRVVYVQHRNQHESTVYAHLSKINVIKGQRLRKGETVGLVGASGIATGSHLHFEFRIDNEPSDPVMALAQQKSYVPISASDREAFDRVASNMHIQLTAGRQVALAAQFE